MTFMDVGANVGQTLAEVTKERWGFDRIHAIEPEPAAYAALRAAYGHERRVTLHNIGLADGTGFRNLYGTNEHIEASIYPDKNDVDATVATLCKFVEASEFFRMFVEPGAVMKLNCEGAEIEILDNLIDTGELFKLAAVMIDFDIRKVPGMEANEQRVLGRLRDAGFDRYQLCDDVMRGDTHQDRIANWLGGVL